MASAEKHKKKKIMVTDIIVVILLVILILLVVFTGIMIFRTMMGDSSENKSDGIEQIRKNVIVYDSTVTGVYDPEMLNSVSSHDVKMNSEWLFPDGKSASEDAYVENPSSNINSVYFDIRISGKEDLLLTSPVMPPGSHMESIVLDKVLQAGDYNCVMTYYIIGSDENQSVGELQMALKIKIRN